MRPPLSLEVAVQQVVEARRKQQALFRRERDADGNLPPVNPADEGAAYRRLNSAVDALCEIAGQAARQG